MKSVFRETHGVDFSLERSLHQDNGFEDVVVTQGCGLKSWIRKAQTTDK
jgi:hypothetical protein